MDKFQLDIKISKWNDAIRFLKEHRNDLDENEWIAFEALADYWRTKHTFDPLDAEEINENINLLVECDRLHPNNREIIEKSKEFRGIASQIYTGDAETFAQFRKAMLESGNIRQNKTENTSPRRTVEPPKPQPPRIIITSAEFCGSDVNRNIQIPFGSPITTAVKYLQARIHYRVEGDKSKDLSVFARIIDPSGNLKGSKGLNYTVEGTLNPRENVMTFYGWGNNDGTSYCAGKTKFEVVFNDEVIYSTVIDIIPAWPTTPPSIVIKSVTFNNSDYNNNIITPFGTILPSDSKYIRPKIEFSVIHPENRTVTIGVKYFDPAGNPIISKSEKDGMTTSAQLGLWQDSPLSPVGYGNNDGTFYRPGIYKVEIYENGTKIHTTQFTVRPDAIRKPEPVTPQQHNIYPSKPKPKTKGKSGRVAKVFVTLVFILVAGIFAFNYFRKCVRSDDMAGNEPYVQVMAEGIYLRKTPEAAGSSNMIGSVPYGSKLIVTDSTTSGWYKVKVKDTGEEGYVASEYTLPSPQFENLDKLWGSNSVRKEIDGSRQRKALLDFLNRNSLKTGNGEWQIPQVQGYVTQPRLKDGYDTYPEFAFLLKNNATGQKYSAIYSFTSDGEPILRYSQPVNTTGDIRNVTYSKKRGYRINYTKAASEEELIPSPAENTVIKADEEAVKNTVPEKAQPVNETTVEVRKDQPDNSNTVFTSVEHPASFPGGEAAMMQWISKHIKYPTDAAEHNISGRVVLRFTVEKDGSISNITVLRSVHPSLDREAIRVVSAMPRWIPGQHNGANVRTFYSLPVTFRLQN